jgi:hypothetical protein
MSTDDAKQIHERRAATAETVNADAKAHRPHLQPPALHHPERVATLTLTVDRSSSRWCAHSRPALADTHVIPAVAALKLCPSVLCRPADRAIAVADLRSRAARRTVPKL